MTFPFPFEYFPYLGDLIFPVDTIYSNFWLSPILGCDLSWYIKLHLNFVPKTNVKWQHNLIHGIPKRCWFKATYSVKEPNKMMKFNRSAFLIGNNIFNVSKRTLFSEKYLFGKRLQKRRPTFRTETDNNCQFANQLKNISIPRLLKTYLQTQVATRNDEHIEILRQRLIRIYENSNKEPVDTPCLYQLGPEIMQWFHQLDWPEKALQVEITKSMHSDIGLNNYFIINLSNMFPITLSFITSSITNILIPNELRWF